MDSKSLINVKWITQKITVRMKKLKRFKGVQTWNSENGEWKSEKVKEKLFKDKNI